MIKQLLTIIQIILLAASTCDLNPTISALAQYTITITNAHLNNKVSDYTIANVHNNTQYALAVHGMEVDALGEWSLMFRQINRGSLVVRFKHELVNWIKVSCTILASERTDLILGFTYLNTIKTTVSATSSNIQIPLSKANNFHNTSIAFAFINGFKMTNNNTNNRHLEIKAAQIKQKSIIFSILFNTKNARLQNVYFSYIIFSPLKASFQSYGDHLNISLNVEERYVDLSESLFFGAVKFYGFTGLTFDSQSHLIFRVEIDDELVLSSVSHPKSINLQYILLLPQTYNCQQCNQTNLYKNTCVQVCPNNTILYEVNEMKYCKPCSNKLNLIISNQTCICAQPFIMNSDNICVNRSSQQMTKQTIALNDGLSNLTEGKMNLNKNCDNISNSMFIDNKCTCMVGYVNLSNHCVPLVSSTLGNIDNSSNHPIKNLTMSQISLKSEGHACRSYQQFSITLKQCKCIIGYAYNNASLCVSICKNGQKYDQKSNKCLCSSGEGRINGQCIVCSNNTNLNGNQTCYSNPKGFYCLNNYYFLDNFCYNCPSIKTSTVINGTCKICLDGFTYNGSSCICQEGNKIINSACIGRNCGDGKIDRTIQTCDDGNVINGDGCSSQCIIEQNYYCLNQPSLCELTICGNGRITGAQQCDDSNTNNSDGCSSLCLIESNYTCLESPSACFNIKTGNLTLLSIFSNNGNAFLTFQIPFIFKNMKAIEIEQLIRQQALNYKIITSIYCQQDPIKLNRFNILVIFPKGIPQQKTYFSFSYSYNNQTGNLIVPIVRTSQQFSRIARQKG